MQPPERTARRSVWLGLGSTLPAPFPVLARRRSLSAGAHLLRDEETKSKENRDNDELPHPSDASGTQQHASLITGRGAATPTDMPLGALSGCWRFRRGL